MFTSAQVVKNPVAPNRHFLILLSSGDQFDKLLIFLISTLFQQFSFIAQQETVDTVTHGERTIHFQLDNNPLIGVGSLRV